MQIWQIDRCTTHYWNCTNNLPASLNCCSPGVTAEQCLKWSNEGNDGDCRHRCAEDAREGSLWSLAPRIKNCGRDYFKCHHNVMSCMRGSKVQALLSGNSLQIGCWCCPAPHELIAPSFTATQLLPHHIFTNVLYKGSPTQDIFNGRLTLKAPSQTRIMCIL